jgi:NADP-dependent aldehyde dehydrogenase
MHSLTGKSIIAGRPHSMDDLEATFSAVNPATERSLAPEFEEADLHLVNDAVRAAVEAFPVFSRTTAARRSTLLETIAERLEAHGEAITERAHLESALPMARLTGELGRTCGQLRLFADLIRQRGDGPTAVDTALPERAPLPRPDLRQRAVALGPVAVFGASNFPLAFSAAGGDTASALAAGCTVVVKGHPAHPGTSEWVALAIDEALEEVELPAGVFNLVQSSRNEVAASLVRHPAIRAVGFTGSLRGGRTLCDVAAARPDPIPVFAEMGSINPLLLFPHALQSRADTLAAAYIGSLTLGEGQFCTNPGLLIAIQGEPLDRFVAAAAEALSEHRPSSMLTRGIRDAYNDGLNRTIQCDGVSVLAEGGSTDGRGTRATACLLGVDASDFLEQPRLREEIFGPAALLVRCRDANQMLAVATSLSGQLTATLQVDDEDRDLAERLLPELETRAGRIVFNGFPTGVEVCQAMVHGGPWPATSDARTTSVGTAAMDRFQRLICFQDYPENWRPSWLEPAQ